MKKNLFFTSIVALSGGITGAIFFLAVSHLNDNLINIKIHYIQLFVSIMLCSVIFPLLWLLFTAYFIKTFKTNPEKTMKEIGIIFMAPVPAAAALAPLFLFYGKIAAIKLKVVGYIYLPFINYLHVNPAGYYLFTLLGFIIVTIAALLLYKFAACLYSAEQIFDERQKAVMIFASLFVFFAVVTSYITVIYPPTGDEPHYLTISQSLANDFDLNLENNYLKGTYRQFYPAEIDYRSIHNTVDKNGKGIYSLHFAGLPALISVFQGIAGRFGVQLFMNFITAALAALFFIFLRKNGINENISIISVFTFFTAVPFSIASSLVMTEVPAAILILYAVMKLMDFNKEGNSFALFGVIAFLPWLHPKLAVFSLVFFVWYYVKIAAQRVFSPQKEAINFILPAISAGIMIEMYFSIFGKFAPFAITSIYKTPDSYFDFKIGHAITSIVAVIFDRDYGLITYAPVYITGFFGLAYAFTKEGKNRFVPAIVAVPYLVMFIFWNDWGGSMYPARQLIPILPLAAYYAAYFMQEKDFSKKVFYKFLAVYSMAVSFILVIIPALRYASGREKIYPIFEKLKFNILCFFPSFREVGPSNYIIATLYITFMVILYLKYSKIKKIPI